MTRSYHTHKGAGSAESLIEMPLLSTTPRPFESFADGPRWRRHRRWIALAFSRQRPPAQHMSGRNNSGNRVSVALLRVSASSISRPVTNPFRPACAVQIHALDHRSPPRCISCSALPRPAPLRPPDAWSLRPQVAAVDEITRVVTRWARQSPSDSLSRISRSAVAIVGHA